MTRTNVKLTDDFLKQVAYRVNELILEKFDAEEHITFDEYEPSEKFQKAIEEIFEKRRKRRSIRTVRTVVVIAAILAMLFACALSVSAVRQAISNFLFSFKADHAVVYVNNRDEAGDDNALQSLTEIETYYEPSYIPDGFEETMRGKEDAQLYIYYSYEDSFILYRQEIAPDSSIVDIETALSSEMYVNNTVIYYSITDSETIIVWYDQQYVYKITSNLEMETIIEISESLK